ncbi:MAG: hypothetical protein QOH96_2761, partial [Blastocatellia bacterium]|nr:hypothetical protein [Blastocatellia bacterium]
IRREDHEKRFTDNRRDIDVDLRRTSQGQTGTDKKRRSRQWTRPNHCLSTTEFGKFSDDHSCHRVLVVSGPGHPCPTAHTNRSRSETDAGGLITGYGAGSLCNRLHQKGAECSAKKEATSLRGVRRQIARFRRLRGRSPYSARTRRLQFNQKSLAGVASDFTLERPSKRSARKETSQVGLQLCSGQLDLKTAQQAIAADWVGAYKFYVSPNPPNSRVASTATLESRLNPDDVWLTPKAGNIGNPVRPTMLRLSRADTWSKRKQSSKGIFQRMVQENEEGYEFKADWAKFSTTHILVLGIVQLRKLLTTSAHTSMP